MPTVVAYYNFLVTFVHQLILKMPNVVQKQNPISEGSFPTLTYWLILQTMVPHYYFDVSTYGANDNLLLILIPLVNIVWLWLVAVQFSAW